MGIYYIAITQFCPQLRTARMQEHSWWRWIHQRGGEWAIFGLPCLSLLPETTSLNVVNSFAAIPENVSFDCLHRSITYINLDWFPHVTLIYGTQVTWCCSVWEERCPQTVTFLNRKNKLSQLTAAYSFSGFYSPEIPEVFIFDPIRSSLQATIWGKRIQRLSCDSVHQCCMLKLEFWF